MSIYQENKNFVNKFKSMLDSEAAKYNSYAFDNPYKIRAYANDTSLNKSVIIYFYPRIEKGIQIVETRGRLYFCVRLKENKRGLITQTEEYWKDTERLASIEYLNSYFSYRNSDEMRDLRNFLDKKGITHINGKSVKSLDDSNLYWELLDERNLSPLDGYPKLKPLVAIINELKTCPIETVRHPDMFKNISDKELMPVAYIDDDKGQFVYGCDRARSRKATGFLNRPYIEDVDNRFSRYAKDAIKYAPYYMWDVFVPKSSMINEQRTFSATSAAYD